MTSASRAVSVASVSTAWASRRTVPACCMTSLARLVTVLWSCRYVRSGTVVSEVEVGFGGACLGRVDDGLVKGLVAGFQVGDQRSAGVSGAYGPAVGLSGLHGLELGGLLKPGEGGCELFASLDGLGFLKEFAGLGGVLDGFGLAHLGVFCGLGEGGSPGVEGAFEVLEGADFAAADGQAGGAVAEFEAAGVDAFDLYRCGGGVGGGHGLVLRRGRHGCGLGGVGSGGWGGGGLGWEGGLRRGHRGGLLSVPVGLVEAVLLTGGGVAGVAEAVLCSVLVGAGLGDGVADAGAVAVAGLAGLLGVDARPGRGGGGGLRVLLRVGGGGGLGGGLGAALGVRVLLQVGTLVPGDGCGG